MKFPQSDYIPAMAAQETPAKKKLMVVNRGEIAIRIFRAAKEANRVLSDREIEAALADPETGPVEAST